MSLTSHHANHLQLDRQLNPSMNPYDQVRYLQAELEQASGDLRRSRQDVARAEAEIKRLNTVVASMTFDLKREQARGDQQRQLMEVMQGHGRTASAQQHNFDDFRMNHGSHSQNQLPQFHQRATSGQMPGSSTYPDSPWKSVSQHDDGFSTRHGTNSGMSTPRPQVPISAIGHNAPGFPSQGNNAHMTGARAHQGFGASTPTMEMARLGLDTGRAVTPAHGYHQQVGFQRPQTANSQLSFRGEPMQTAPAKRELQVQALQPTPSSSHQGQLTVKSNLPKTSFDSQKEFKTVFGLVEMWTSRFCSKPQETDRSMSVEFRNAMNKVTYSFSVNTFFEDPKIRPMMIRRFIIETATNEIWKLSIVKDFHNLPGQQAELAAVRTNMKKATNEASKAALYTMQKEMVSAMKAHDTFEAYLNHKAAESGKELFNHLLPFIDAEKKVGASTDFRWLWEQVHAVGAMMFCTTYSYRFDYIKPTNNSFFNPAYMESVDPREQDVSAEELKKRDVRATACITPVVVMTEMVSETIAPKTLLKAKVLVRQ